MTFEDSFNKQIDDKIFKNSLRPERPSTVITKIPIKETEEDEKP